jgi:hypothetical protein
MMLGILLVIAVSSERCWRLGYLIAKTEQYMCQILLCSRKNLFLAMMGNERSEH